MALAVYPPEVAAAWLGRAIEFGLLVCEPGLVPFQRQGWRSFPGELLMTQRQATVPFTFNLVVTTPIRLPEPLAGTIDLMGPPW